MIGNWNKFTRSVCTTEALGGGHFFIHSHAERIADVIKACYSKTINLPA
jgi:surfactin synthase thioesterase subunit